MMVNPRLLRYPRLVNVEPHIHETIRGKDASEAAREVSEQIHTLPLLSPEFCAKLLIDA